jgi:hypothetical protein
MICVDLNRDFRLLVTNFLKTKIDMRLNLSNVYTLDNSMGAQSWRFDVLLRGWRLVVINV